MGEDELDEAPLLKPLVLLKDINEVHPNAASLPVDADEDDAMKIVRNFYIPSLKMRVSAPWVKAVEKSLESLIWRLFNDQKKDAENHVMFVADPSAAGLKADKAVLVGAPLGTDLMFAGPITTDPGVNSIKVADIGGVTFYMNPPLSNGPSSEVLVPAWLAKPSPKKDQQTLRAWMVEISIYVQASGEVSTWKPNSLRDLCNEMSELKERAGSFLWDMRGVFLRGKEALTTCQRERDELKAKLGLPSLEAIPEKDALPMPKINEQLVETKVADTSLDSAASAESTSAVANDKNDEEVADKKDEETVANAEQDQEAEGKKEGNVEGQSKEDVAAHDVAKDKEGAEDKKDASADGKNGEKEGGSHDGGSSSNHLEQLKTISESSEVGAVVTSPVSAPNLQDPFGSFDEKIPAKLLSAMEAWGGSPQYIPAPLFIKTHVQLQMPLGSKLCSG